MTELSWNLLACCRSQINLDKLLVCGQSFRWKKNSVGEWLGVMSNLVWRLRQTAEGIQYQVYGNEADVNETVCTITAVNWLSSAQNAQQKSLEKDKTDHCHIMAEPEYSKHVISHRIRSSLPDINDTVKRVSETTQRMPSRKRGAADFTRSHSIATLKSQCQSCDASGNQVHNGQVKKSKKSQRIEGSRHGEYCSDLEECHYKKGRPFCDEENTSFGSGRLGHERHSAVLKDYFQLDIDIKKLYSDWSAADPHFSEVSANFEGIRILRQDPTENLLSFVCSSNNHISRIASMVEKLCLHYGKRIAVAQKARLRQEEHLAEILFKLLPINPCGTFHWNPLCDPKSKLRQAERRRRSCLLSLSGDHVESHLRELGFGYRAKFISSIAKHIVEHRADGWLECLRLQSYDKARKELLSLMGVGHKVADCVCLMSLDKPEAVPVDTHVWQITLKHYMAHLKSAKSLTDKIYNDIGDFYRKLWGPYAGWAHAVLFTADLKQNKADISQQTVPKKKKK